MIEGRGLHALDFAGGPFGVLELGNLDWVTDDGKPALLFADTPRGKIAYPRVGGLELGYFGHPSYHGRGKVPVAVAGHHGKEGGTLTGFTLIARVKPAARMGKSEQGMGGDILGVGARRIILRLVGMEAPYKLQAALDNKDLITTSDAPIDANRWYQVAVTGELTPEKKWRARMYLDGKMIQQGDTMRTSGPIAIPGSVVMGTELFYFHNSFYRGLLGRTLIFDRCLADEELSTLVSNSR